MVTNEKRKKGRIVITNYEEIVNNFTSPTFVIAGPGAGKTHLLADRVVRLLKKDKDKDNKNKITLLAFTKDARQRMEDELISEWNLDFKKLPQIRTTHSLGFEIVQKAAHDVNLRKTNLKLQSKKEIRRLMFRDAALILKYDEEESIEAHKCKNLGDCKIQPSTEKCQICKKYRQIMRKCNRIDFDDQIFLAYEILEKNSELLKEYQHQAKYLLIDEYQDFNAAQFKLIELLSRESRNGLFVVGDPAQSIYSFRGGNPKFILRFEQDFTGAKHGCLSDSWRCPPEIMKYAFKILNKYFRDYKGFKKIEDLDFHIGPGKKPYLVEFTCEDEEAKRTAKIARTSLEDGKNVLILAPNDKFFKLLISKLRVYRVPYECNEDFLPKRLSTAKRFLEWLKNPNDTFATRLAIERLITGGAVDVPGARKETIKNPDTRKKRVEIERHIAVLWEMVDNKNDLFSVLCNLNNPHRKIQKISSLLNNLNVAYNKYKYGNRGEFMKQLCLAAKIWIDPGDFEKDLDVLAGLAPPTPFGVTKVARLRTMKEAKGLQADVVIIVGLEDGIFPNPKYDKDEEARLFYVSMTRAKEKLYLFHANRRPGDISFEKFKIGRDRSEFLNDLGIDSISPWKLEEIETCRTVM